MLLRVASLSDVESISELLAADHVSDFVSGATPEEIAASIADPNEEYLLAVDGSVVGFGLLSGLRSPHRSVEIRKVAVAATGRGHGSALMELLIARSFDEHGAHRLWLDVFPHNKVARNVYAKCGFTDEGVMRDAYRYGDEYRSVHILSMLEPEFRNRSSA